MKLFAAQGYRSVSMRAIAAELEWSAPALYRYYENKEALVGSIRAGGFARLETLLARERAQMQSGQQAAIAAMRSYIQFGVEHKELYRLMYELDQGDITELPEVAAARQRAFHQAELIAGDTLAQIGRSGDANAMAHLMWIAAHGLIALALANQLDLGKSLDELIAPVITTVLTGIQQSE
jgi:AcrR family transcriptional regulator